MKLRTTSYLAGVCTALAALATPLVAAAAPVVLGPGQTHTFNFDASALGPYAKVYFGLGFDEVDGVTQAGDATVFGGLNGTLPRSGFCHANADFGSFCVPIIEGLNFNSPSAMLDGDFSLVISAGQGTFSIDPFAKIYLNANDTTFVRLNAVGQGTVPEPSSLALLGAALAAAAVSRRKA
jgi:hypothetical protein